MDYEAHKETYEGFLSLVKVSVMAILNIMVALVLFAFGGSWSTWTGTIMVVLLIITGSIGLFAGPRGWIPSALVLALGVVFVILTVA